MGTNQAGRPQRVVGGGRCRRGRLRLAWLHFLPPPIVPLSHPSTKEAAW